MFYETQDKSFVLTNVDKYPNEETSELVGLNDYNPNHIDLRNLEERLHYPLSDDDIELYLGKKANIINFSELKNYKHIDDLLPTNLSYVIILIEQQKNSGHWITIMKYNNTIEYFNSYGFKPNYEMKFLNKLFGQNKNDLTRLLTKNNYDVIYNSFKFQDIKNPNSNACGRHIICRIIAMKNLQQSLPEYISMMKKLQKKYELDYDMLVSLLI